MSWGLIGYGEAGRVIGGLVARGGMDLVVHDRAFADPVPGDELCAAVASTGATAARTVDGLAGFEVVLSLVTPETAVAAARSFAPHVRDGVLYVDLNSTAPTDKHEVAAALPGVRVVNGVMTGGGIKLDAERISFSLAGPDADEAAELLRGLGLQVAVVGAEVGAAAALKMLRSVVIKSSSRGWRRCGRRRCSPPASWTSSSRCSRWSRRRSTAGRRGTSRRCS